MQIDRLSIALGRALDEWESENGAFTADELAAAAEQLGLRRPRAPMRTRGR